MALDWDKLNRIKQTVASGYGSTDTAFVLNSSSPSGGFTVIDSSFDGSVLDYYAENKANGEYEVGKGTYTHSGLTLARSDADVSQSSNSNNRVNFTSAPTVSIDWTGRLYALLDTLLNVTGNGTAAGARTALGVTATEQIPNTGRNKIINGNFDIWQRNTSQTNSDYGSDDRWINSHSGTTKTHSRQAFTSGQTDVPNNPEYYSRTVATSSAGASNYCAKSQRIEYVSTLPGETATLSFYAKADAAKDIAIEFVQNFGTGGSPSSSVTEIGVTSISLTTSWAKYEVTVSVPSISGKTLGTDNNDYLEVNFWFDAGSDFDARTNSLGQQSGTFDLARVQFELGSTATDFERRSIGEELSLCERFYQKTYNLETPPGTSLEYKGAFGTRKNVTNTYEFFQTKFSTRMRGVPTVTPYNPETGGANNIRASGTNYSTNGVSGPSETHYCYAVNTNSSITDNSAMYVQFTADAEL